MDQVLAFIKAVLAAYCLAAVIADSPAGAPVRKVADVVDAVFFHRQVIGYMVRCYLCLSFWMTLFVIARDFGLASDWHGCINVAFAVSGAVYLIDRHDPNP